MVREGDNIKLEDGRKGKITHILDYREDNRYLILFSDKFGNVESFIEGDYEFSVV